MRTLCRVGFSWPGRHDVYYVSFSLPIVPRLVHISLAMISFLSTGTAMNSCTLHASWASSVVEGKWFLVGHSSTSLGVQLACSVQ